MWDVITTQILIFNNFKFIPAYTEAQNQSDCNEVIDLLKYILNNSKSKSNNFLKYFALIDNNFLESNNNINYNNT